MKPMRFGTRLRWMRVAAGASLEEVADLLGLDKVELFHIEEGLLEPLDEDQAAQVAAFLLEPLIEGARPVVFDINTIDTGVRDLVKLLQEHGFETCDSGDGSKAESMGCALAFPHVFANCAADDLVREVDRMAQLLEANGYAGWEVEGSFKAGEPGILMATLGTHEHAALELDDQTGSLLADWARARSPRLDVASPVTALQRMRSAGDALADRVRRSR